MEACLYPIWCLQAFLSNLVDNQRYRGLLVTVKLFREMAYNQQRTVLSEKVTMQACMHKSVGGVVH